MSSVTSNEAVVWSVYGLRQLISFLTEWLIIRPCYLVIDISKKVLKRDQAKGLFEGSRYVFDTTKRWDRILRSYLLKATKIGSVASGITSTTDILGELAIADKNIMFLGFSTENAHSTFGLRGAKAEDGSYGVDLLWVSSLKRLGRFSVLGYDKIEEDGIKVDCIWVSGVNSGRRFQLGRIRTFADLKKQTNDKISPSHVYRQSALIVIVLQVLAVFGLKSAYELILSAWAHIAELIHKI